MNTGEVRNGRPRLFAESAVKRVVLPADVARALDAEARRRGATASGVIRLAVTHYLRNAGAYDG